MTNDCSRKLRNQYGGSKFYNPQSHCGWMAAADDANEAWCGWEKCASVDPRVELYVQTRCSGVAIDVRWSISHQLLPVRWRHDSRPSSFIALHTMPSATNLQLQVRILSARCSHYGVKFQYVSRQACLEHIPVSTNGVLLQTIVGLAHLRNSSGRSHPSRVC